MTLNAVSGIGTMETEEDQVRYVLLMSPMRPGSLTLAEMEDGTLRILRDGKALAGCVWTAASLPSAVQKFQELKEAWRGVE
jgi:hypothetical protein